MCQAPALCVRAQLCVSGPSFVCQAPALCVVPQLCVSGSSFVCQGPSFVCQAQALCVRLQVLCVRPQLCVSVHGFVCQAPAFVSGPSLQRVRPQLAACQAPACSVSGPSLQHETGMFNAWGPHSVHQTGMFPASDPLCVRQEYLMCQTPASSRHVCVSRLKLSTFIRHPVFFLPEIQKSIGHFRNHSNMMAEGRIISKVTS